MHLYKLYKLKIAVTLGARSACCSIATWASHWSSLHLFPHLWNGDVILPHRMEVRVKYGDIYKVLVRVPGVQEVPYWGILLPWFFTWKNRSWLFHGHAALKGHRQGQNLASPAAVWFPHHVFLATEGRYLLGTECLYSLNIYMLKSQSPV